MTSPRAIKGMNDVLPDEIGRWQLIQRTYARTMSLHGFREVRTPCVEATPLFVRTMGEATDVVEKEMYSFTHHDEALSLRPEGTAGAARAYIEHAVHAREAVTRWWYAGPMFRAEVFGDEGPGCDAEMVSMLFGFLTEIGVPGLEVFVNTIGAAETRIRYR